MNKPYVKIIENGVVKNPINGQYLHQHPNRQQRRENKQKHRFKGNHKGVSITEVREGNKVVKYFREIQRICNKVIFHYRKK